MSIPVSSGSLWPRPKNITSNLQERQVFHSTKDASNAPTLKSLAWWAQGSNFFQHTSAMKYKSRGTLVSHHQGPLTTVSHFVGRPATQQN